MLCEFLDHVIRPSRSSILFYMPEILSGQSFFICKTFLLTMFATAFRDIANGRVRNILLLYLKHSCCNRC